MNKIDVAIAKIIEMIIIVNSVTVAIIMGMVLMHFNINEYLSFIIIIVGCFFISNLAEKSFQKKFPKEYQICQSKTFTIISTLIVVLFIAMYIYFGQYIYAILMLLVPIFIYLFINIIQTTKKDKTIDISIK